MTGHLESLELLAVLLLAVEGHSPWSRKAVNPPPICVADIEEDPSLPIRFVANHAIG